MFERFTEQARQVVVLAQESARQLHHNYIGTEHLLLGLLREPGFYSAVILNSFGVYEENAREQVIAAVGPAEEPTTGQIPFSPRAKKVLELSLREALALGHGFIGTGHVLLGLLREEEGLATPTLVALGADPQRIRERALQRIDESERETPPRRLPEVTPTPDSPIRVAAIGFNSRPDPQLRQLLMSAGAQALREGREEFGMTDLLKAIDESPEARAVFRPDGDPPAG